jgi:hypothetical protein
MAAIVNLFIGWTLSFPAWGQQAASPKPSFLTSLDEIARIVRLPDHRLLAIFQRTTPGQPELAGRYSTDNGRTWGPAVRLLGLPPDEMGWGSAEPFVDKRGELQLFFLKGRKKTPSGLDIDIWHCRSTGQRTKWTGVRCIWKGYTGSLNSVVQLRSGRILLPFSYMTSRSWADRGAGFAAFTYHGTFESSVLYSDDGGDSWQCSPAQLKAPAPDLGTYGAIEPVVVERSDGLVWMLIRTQHGRFYEAFSKDGISWSQPQPTVLLSSDSPGGLVRLDDGRIVLFWNNCLRFPYAYGGRHVLHAAVTADYGKTWTGFREVVRDPARAKPPPTSGDHGACYPIPVLANDGRIIFTTGLHDPKAYNALLDPKWLYAAKQNETFEEGLGNWSAFGVRGVELAPHPNLSGARVLHVFKPSADWPSGAAWNFPAGRSGRLRLRLQTKSGFGGARIGITDHFSVPFDDQDTIYNLYNVTIDPDGRLGTLQLKPERWYVLELRWDRATRTCQVLVDDQQAAKLNQSRETLGACYLRLRPLAVETDKAGFLVESIAADVEAEARCGGTAKTNGIIFR